MAQGTIKQVTNNSGSNYCKMPDGTLLQWGIANEYTPGNTKDVVVQMPIAFTSTYTIVANGQVASDTTNYEVIIVIQPNSGSQFTAHIRNTTAAYTRQFYWLAIGRWK